MSSPIRSIAIIDPIGDFGIGGYVYELAEGLAANDVRVDVYTNGLSHMKDVSLPRHHRLLPLLGSPLFRQRRLIRAVLDGSASLLRSGDSHHRGDLPMVSRRTRWVTKAGDLLLPIELALYLKKCRYDLIWTQWPEMSRYGIRFWVLCKALGMWMVHTVHNVCPHEETSNDQALVRRVYEYSNSLIVHSEYSRQELLRMFPGCNGKTLLIRYGLYTMFPRLEGERRKLRERLSIPEDAVVLLFFGSVRPYKNIDAVLESMGNRRSENTILVVAGREFGYPDLVPGDPLGRTRRIASALGVLDRVRLIPGLLDLTATAGLFEMADILLLPYLKSYGSGVLLLGMTFGLHIAATKTGGMDEYLREYPACTLLDGSDTESVGEGMGQAIARLLQRGRPQHFTPHDLEWRTIAKSTLQSLEARGPAR